ncbi:MAG: Gfo/Idh/MocA family oxidoreductase [Phycisphaerales bacterium]|jgi:myo-inositol 2-dehydrogenase / D-chiro-inositol 1-dehydrogenase|nr:Gfo/Idh/MocA family oxidoreductase [Phycisphaerales bacterium]
MANGKITRRSFVGGAAGAVGATLMKPSLVRGAEANAKIKVGVVGLGGRGGWIANLIKAHGGYQITAVADYFDTVAQGVGKRLGVEKSKCFSGLSGYKKVLASGVDAVFLETPPCFFPEHATAAVAAGCHIYVAKPVACDVPGCMTIAEMAAKSQAAKKVFLVDFQTRTDPIYIKAIKSLLAEDIGSVGMLCSQYIDESFPDPPKTKTIESRLRRLIWTNDVAIGGGFLVNAGIHAVDVGLWMAGGQTPVSVSGAGAVGVSKPNGDTNRVYSLTFQFKDGLFLNHRGEHLRNSTRFAADCMAHCQRGYLDTQYAGLVKMMGKGVTFNGGKVVSLYGQGAKRNIATFHESITKGDCSNPTVKPSVDATLTTILGRQAALKKGTVTWDEMIKANKKVPVDLSGLKE